MFIFLKKQTLFLLIRFVLLFIAAVIFLSFDKTAYWKDEKRVFPTDDKDWALWFEKDDYRYPLFARRHFIRRGEATLDLVFPYVSNRNKVVRFFAINALAETRSLKTLPVILEEAKNPASDNCAYALETLMNYPEGEWINYALPVIRERVKDGSVLVKISAVRALAVFGESSDIRLLDEIEVSGVSAPESETLIRNINISKNKLKIRTTMKIKEGTSK